MLFEDLIHAVRGVCTEDASGFGKRKETKRMERKLRQVRGLRALAHKQGAVMVRGGGEDYGREAKTLRAASRGKTTLGPNIFSRSNR